MPDMPELNPNQVVEWNSLSRSFEDSGIAMQDIHNYLKIKVLDSIGKINDLMEKELCINFYKELVRLHNANIADWSPRTIGVSNSVITHCLDLYSTLPEIDRNSFKDLIFHTFSNNEHCPFHLFQFIDILKAYYANNNTLSRSDFTRFLMDNNIIALTVVRDLSEVRESSELAAAYERNLLRLRQEEEIRRQIEERMRRANEEISMQSQQTAHQTTHTSTDHPIILINGKQISNKQVEALRKSYSAITGYQFDEDQSFNIFTDVIRAMDFISKGGQLWYEFEGSQVPQNQFNLTSNTTEEFQHGTKIRSIEQAKIFVETQIKTGTLKNILTELQKTENDHDTKVAGQMLDAILLDGKQFSQSLSIKENQPSTTNKRRKSI